MIDRVTLYALNVTPLQSEALFGRYYESQPGWRKEKINALRRRADKLLSLGAGILLQAALPGAELSAMAFGENGKPYLPGETVHFNLSHAGEWVLCAVSNAPVGCDVELLRRWDMNVARRFFSAEETALLEAAQNDAARADLFFRLWTLKESYIKAVGEGLRLPLDSFTVRFVNNAPALAGLEDTWRLREYALRPQYRCAVCAAAGAALPATVEYLQLEKGAS